MEAVCRTGAAAVDRLRDLGLSVEDFNVAVGAAYAEAMGCTDLDSPGAAGYVFWTRSNRYLRERLLPSGWAYSNRYNILKTINPDGEFAITAISARGAVGKAGRPVSCKNPKGAAVAELVQLNESWEQLTIFPLELDEKALQSDEMPTWFLLYKSTDDGGIAMELSMPIQMHGKFVDTWSERIILPTLPGDGPSVDLAIIDDPTPPVQPDVAFERRISS